jgi:hypothetical protein
MMLYRGRIVRIVFATLALTLSVRLVEAQPSACGSMTPSHTTAVTKHHEHASKVASVATRIAASVTENSGAAHCDQALLCTSGPGMPASGANTIRVDKSKVWISVAAGALEARRPNTDPPPPRI